MTDADFLRIVTGGFVYAAPDGGRASISYCTFDGHSVVIWLAQ
jgi:hypothetical protein